MIQKSILSNVYPREGVYRSRALIRVVAIPVEIFVDKEYVKLMWEKDISLVSCKRPQQEHMFLECHSTVVSITANVTKLTKLVSK